MSKKYQVTGGCALCLMCVYECPVHAISIIENVKTTIDQEKCVGCGRCVDNCQAEAIHLVQE